MSSLLGLTPTVQIALDNPFAGITYPQDGSVSAIIDTSYEGFAMIPKTLFQKLGLNSLRIERRSLAMANNAAPKTHGTYAVLKIPHLSFRMDGFVETLQGLDEIIVGVEALEKLNVILDYCTKRVTLQKCS